MATGIAVIIRQAGVMMLVMSDECDDGARRQNDFDNIRESF